MRKLLQLVVCGLAAASFSVLAADDMEKSTGSKATDMKADKPVGKRSAKKEEKHDRQSGAGGTMASPRSEAAPAPLPTPVDREGK